ncbi:hypothetical protein B0H14DRAFT_3039591 [Mycena olivaceomarginata]|nr:hypothetical protein B0H14DRAFT_3039591 [Mycena olivaceomarginata]
MTAALEDAVSASADPLTQPMLSVMPVIPPSQRKRGRPRKDIDKEFLAGALALRGPAGIAKSLDCHARTVRRRALEYGLAEPGPPCFEDVVQPDGTFHRIWQSTGPPISAISDMPERLDQVMADILRRLPISVFMGHLRVCFNERRLERRQYSVPGVNSLWHHDGQHSANPTWVAETLLIFVSK